jgi:D-alanyl-D-alanine carboxypeptidase
MMTTAYDTLKIAIAASENQLYMEICSAVKYNMSATNKSAARQFYNRNYLVSSNSNANYFDSRCAGMNAGYSGEAGGWSIITLIHDDGADYICVLLGGRESEDGSEIYAYDTVNTLIKWACNTYNNHKLFEKGHTLGEVEIKMTALGSKKVSYATATDCEVYIPNHSNPDLTYKIEYIKD